MAAATVARASARQQDPPRQTSPTGSSVGRMSISRTQTPTSPLFSHQDSRNFSQSATAERAYAEAQEVNAEEVLAAAGNAQSYGLRRTTTIALMPWGQRHFPMLTRMVMSRNFEVFIGLVIIVNCAILGLEAELLLGRAESCRTFVDVMENIITAIFVVEIILRVFIFGYKIYVPAPQNFVNVFDALLVLLSGVLVVWIMPLAGVDSHDSLRALNVLRALRLARLVRVLAQFEIFHEVWLLLRGLMESGRVLFWTIVVIFIITYIFAIIGVTLISIQIQEEYEDIGDPVLQDSSDLKMLSEVTSGVLPLMHTLIQLLTLDSWNVIARPMMKHVPWSWLFFYGYIAIAVIVMMNLVTAVIVDNALKNSQKDASELIKQRERQKQLKLDHFRQVFEDMDADGNGELSWFEFESAYQDAGLAKELHLLGIEHDRCREIFDLLDSGDGVLSITEFFDGLNHMSGVAQAKDLLKANRQVELIVNLICQQNQELREDLDLIMSATFGSRLRERKSTFKNRARHRRQSEIEEEETMEGSTVSSVSLMRPPNVGKTLSGQSQQNKAKFAHVHDDKAGVADAIDRLEQVVGFVTSSKDDLKASIDACLSKVDACSHKMAALIKDMGGMKERINFEYVVSLDGTSPCESNALLLTPKSHWAKKFDTSLPATPRHELNNNLASDLEVARHELNNLS